MSDLSDLTDTQLEQIISAFNSVISDADCAETNGILSPIGWGKVDNALSEGKAKYTAELARRNLK